MIRLDDHQALALALRREWIRSGITLAELGGRIGVRAPQAVSQLLDGSRDIRTSTAIRLAAALGYDLALIPREDAP